ncbi:cation:proton antiporter [Pseudodesulfovibrio pelocollis]|uniref:cation:proton antiporter n=1 Tax=Pseudodesulfovibrio pelocollis TaxID=3051432 RepID=UPI00255B1057|nr:monovalent cation/H(+) antiporter subunit G [Pseudodesulfovibrio sp. SB368]
MIETLVIFLCCAGMLLFLGGMIGILRLPDAYTRLHMAGMLDTLGLLILLLGLVLYGFLHAPMSLLVQFKILLLWGFVLVTSPTATHAMVDAGVRAGLTPWVQPDAKRRRK